MVTKKIKLMIGGALRDEHGARIYYTKLINETRDKHIKSVIREIRGDEIDHFKKLKKIQNNLKGGKK